MKLTITASIHARWGHRVDNLIHTHAWTVEATLEGPLDSKKVYPADDLEKILTDAVEPWSGHYLTKKDVGIWKGILNKIPGFRNIYNALKKISSTVLNTSSESFRKAFLIQYPSKGIWVIAFQSGDYKDEVENILQLELKS